MSVIVSALKSGAGKRRSANALAAAAKRLKCELAVLTAIVNVESQGSGYDKQGRIKVLFEKHKFYANLPEGKRAKAVKLGLARKNWIKPANGGYADQPDNTAALNMLIRAIAIDESAALKSASYGAGQVLGVNFGLCGWKSVQAFVLDMCASEDAQVAAIIGFLEGKGLADEMRARDFDAIERVYNGGGLGGVYAGRMRTEYQRHAGKEAKIDSVVRATGLRIGSTGYRVEALQKRLNELGYPVKVDRDFGEATRRAVVAFQVDNGLADIDGVVGPKTQAALDVAASAVAPARATATVADLREEGSPIVKQADKAGNLGVLGLVGAGVSAVSQAGILDKVKETADSVSGLGPIIEPITGLLHVAAANFWLLAGIGGLVLWYAARRIRAESLADHRAGRTV